MAAHVGPGGDGGVPLPLPPAGAADARRSSTRASWARSSGSRRRCASRCRSSPTSATATSWPAARRWTPAATRSTWSALFGAASPKWFRRRRSCATAGRPGHAGRAALRRRPHRPGPLLDVVDAPAADQRPGGGHRGELSVFNPWRRSLPPAVGPIGRRQTGRAVSRAPLLHLPARRLRRRGAARRTGEDHAADAVANMTVIDAIYRAAGLPLRQPTLTT